MDKRIPLISHQDVAAAIAAFHISEQPKKRQNEQEATHMLKIHKDWLQKLKC
jgi:hypothetical protein